ncbi:CBS domain-containing protein [Desulfuribacillus alkaliarsenatis]|uniref:Inosine-5-monophosphate dehydrogenase n=1 Tax=Desulfuribacillus alkaliarsenatis TaxID=766136 RepID=A0A1E5G139_9FIRM|nr:CBS domain-containing protein [Desulfuribacillus alkaliarsenatis]OEF96544.1 inosine-5-monophosphate dehydrogenase [Desulfuribacillus alkaliarsenatis]
MKNIAFFLLPKAEVTYVYEDSTMRQVLDKMEFEKHPAIPILNHEGKYVGTITEGDLLWKVKNTPNLSFKNSRSVLLKHIERRKTNQSVHIDADIDDLLTLAISQNFVPVVDDQDVFIGIIRRKEIIEYCKKLVNNIRESEGKVDER